MVFDGGSRKFFYVVIKKFKFNKNKKIESIYLKSLFDSLIINTINYIFFNVHNQSIVKL